RERAFRTGSTSSAPGELTPRRRHHLRMHALDEAETRPGRRPARAGGGRDLGSNTGMPTDDDIDRRLTDLEVKASFAEDTLDALNEVILRQQRQIELLLREVAT